MFFYLETQTTLELSSSTPRKRQLRSQIKQLKRKRSMTPEINYNLNDEHFIELCEQKLGGNMAKFIEVQLKLCKTSEKGSRYPDYFKQFALTVYFLGGASVYKFLKNTFRLPSITTLNRITQKWNLFPGMNEFIYEIISLKVKGLSEDAKDCIICADEMSIKTNLFYTRNKDKIIGFHQTTGKNFYKPANHALTIMARGITKKWKQPVCYFFVNNSCPEEDLKLIIFNTISNLTRIGLRVRALVTDQGANFLKFARKLNINAENNSFSVENKKIYYIFDTPHLLKSIRNNVLQNKIKIKEGVIDRKYLDYILESDKGKSFKAVPKLTYKHLHPTPFQKMKVSLAAQVLSNTVSTTMLTHISHGRLPQSAYATALFIGDVDKLFDTLNSSHFSSKEYNRPFMNSEKQRKFLIKMLDMFSEMKVYNNNKEDITSKVKFIEGWIITINSVINLFEDLNTKFLLTKRINQDCLENFFGSIRQKSGNNFNPTPIQFIYSFKKIFCLNYLTHTEGSNCIEDVDYILTYYKESEINLFNNVTEHTKTPEVFNEILSINPELYANMDIPEKNALNWVAGYFFKKCLDEHTCQECIMYAQKDYLDEGSILAYFRAYESTDYNIYGHLKMPRDDFCSYIKKLDDKFCELFPKLSLENNVGQSIKNELEKIHFSPPCENFPLNFLLLLFTRVRIFYTLQFANKTFKNQLRKSAKIIILQHL